MSSKPSYPAAESPSLRRARGSGGASGHRRKPSGPSSTVPFSWEHRPGIPKSPGGLARTPSPTHPLLPLPPPLRSSAGGSDGGSKCKKRSPGARPNFRKRPGGGEESASDDPFVAALAECAKEKPLDMDELFPRRATVAGPRGAAAAAAAAAVAGTPWSISRRFGLFGLYGTCKKTYAVSNSTVRVGPG